MDPGTALAIVSLSFEVFAGCIKAFNLVSEAGNLGRDATLERTKLLLQEYRLVEWARIVQVDRPDGKVVTGLNTSLAALMLAQLERILSSAEVLKQRYKLELVVPDQDSIGLEGMQVVDPSESGSSIVSRLVTARARKEILDRSTKVKAASALPKRLWWAAVDKQKFSLLVADVASIVDGLWMLLDTTNKVHASRVIGDGLHATVQNCEDAGELRHLQAALKDEKNGIELSSTLSASAGLRAAVLSLVTPSGTVQAELLDSTRITTTQQLSSHITMGTHYLLPVLIEDKPVPHKMKGKLRSRVTELVYLLSQSKDSTLSTLPCMGYTEEPQGYRLIFRLPSPNATTDPNLTSEPTTLLRMLSDTAFPLPPVETRLALALEISKTIFSFHAAGWLHKDIRSEHILLTSPNDLSKPVLCGFSFARRDRPAEISHELSSDPAKDIYRHPTALGEAYEGFQRYMDCYSLGCLLIEIAEWAPLRKIVRKAIDIGSPAGVKDDEFAALPSWLWTRYVDGSMAAFRLGEPFAKLLALCIPGKDEETTSLSEFLDALEGLGCYKVS